MHIVELGRSSGWDPPVVHDLSKLPEVSVFGTFRLISLVRKPLKSMNFPNFTGVTYRSPTLQVEALRPAKCNLLTAGNPRFAAINQNDLQQTCCLSKNYSKPGASCESLSPVRTQKIFHFSNPSCGQEISIPNLPNPWLSSKATGLHVWIPVKPTGKLRNQVSILGQCCPNLLPMTILHQKSE